MRTARSESLAPPDVLSKSPYLRNALIAPRAGPLSAPKPKALTAISGGTAVRSSFFHNCSAITSALLNGT